jgi:arginyl-tRNA synthetase
VHNVPTTSARTICAELIKHALAQTWPEGVDSDVVLDRPKDLRHGDYACNVALQLARTLKRSPREIANAIVAAIPASAYVE